MHPATIENAVLEFQGVPLEPKGTGWRTESSGFIWFRAVVRFFSFQNGVDGWIDQLIGADSFGFPGGVSL
jgi:hypothetical protein